MPAWWHVVVIAAIVAASSGCRAAMSIDEAKRVTAEFAGRGFVPPPRTVKDITRALDQHRRVESEASLRARAVVDREPPPTDDRETLATFYLERGRAARALGRLEQELDDFSRAAGYAARMDTLNELSNAHFYGGNVMQAREIRESMRALQGSGLAGWHLHNEASLVRLYATLGDLPAAEAAARESDRLFRESRTWQGQSLETVAGQEAIVATAHASLLEARGRFREAERLYRDSITVLAADPKRSKETWPELQMLRVAQMLIRQGRLLEAENEARSALLGVLDKRGRNSKETAAMLRILTRVIVEQGRYAEAEALAHVSLDIFKEVGAPEDSYIMALVRGDLVAAFVGQHRWRDAVGEYETVRQAMRANPRMVPDVLTPSVFKENVAIALLKTGRVDEAVDMLGELHARHRRHFGDTHPATAETLGVLAAAYAARGDRAGALVAFSQATRVLLDRGLNADHESGGGLARDQRVRLIVGSYINLLARIRGTAAEQRAGIDAAAEAFRLAEAARDTSVQRSVEAAAARAAASTPALAELVRREQDARQQIIALYGVLANALTSSPEGAQTAQGLRAQIDALGHARAALLRQIEREFPAYTGLINAKPLTLADARSRLRPGEALIATYVDDDHTYVWAVPRIGAVAFNAAPIGRKALEASIRSIRAALEPEARTLGDIPSFDVAAAHRLYATLLEPVAEGWRRSESLVVVAHDALGQLPFGLLLTRSVTLPTPQGVLFDNYRQVPWLIRSHAVTVLPSVTALATRPATPAAVERRPFVGFGDPLFSREQAAEAAREQSQQVDAVVEAGPDRRLALRASPKVRDLDRSALALLPRLPDTADEVMSIAAMLDADPSRDVFVGARANEHAVKTHDLARYRVVAFATHGLVPGDLDGLTQPALALSAPEVANVDGDGLLTMDEILGLRLNADWIVLSACNTASGDGAGAEALSGLGRAFFYAGARALLVSNWPVETTSARALTTDLFRRQKENRELTRARALQESMKALIDGPGFVDGRTNTAVFSYAHPIFWAPFTLVGDGGGGR